MQALDKISNKAQVLNQLEDSVLDFGESRKAIIEAYEKSMTKEDWIDYGVLIKLQGAGNMEIAKRVGYSPSWVKKWINPIIKEVTRANAELSSTVSEVTKQPDLGKKSLLDITITDLKKEKRTFAGWGSVEVRDSHKDKIPMEVLEAVMPTYMQRGGPIQFGHSNRHVGKVLKYEFKDKVTDGEKKAGLWLEGQIFNSYQIDDQAWQAIQLAQQLGLPVLSLGATPIGSPEKVCDENECWKEYKNLQLYEFTVTDLQHGSVGANPEATVVAAIAKQKELLEDETVKVEDSQWVGGYLLSMKKQGNMPDSDIELVNLMLGHCTSCQDDYNSLIKSGSSESEAKTQIFNELVKALGIAEKDTDLDKGMVWSPEIKNLTSEINTLETKIGRGETRLKNLKGKLATAKKKYSAAEKSTDLENMTPKDNDKDLDKDEDENPPDDEQEKQEPDLTAVLQQLVQGQKAILAALSPKEDEQKADDEEEEEEEEPDEEKADDQDQKPEDEKKPVLTLSKEAQKKHNLTSEKFETLAKASGYVKVGTTQAPSIDPARDITKGTGTQMGKIPSVEERLAALNKGELSELLESRGITQE